MKTTPLTSATLESYFLPRLARLQADAKPQWGSLDATGMVRHLRFSFDMSLEKVEVEDTSNVLFRNPLFRYLLINVLPTPKGIKADPVFTPAPEGDFDSEMEQLKAVMAEFVAAAEANPERQTLNGAMGMMTMKFWQGMHGNHLKHHLSQFGIQ